MTTSRRTVILVAAAVPAAIGVMRLGDVLRAAVGALRPGSAGGTANRCAACGAQGHTMLDPACPATPRVLAGPSA